MTLLLRRRRIAQATGAEHKQLLSQTIPDWRAVLEFQVANGEHLSAKNRGWQRTPGTVFRNAANALSTVMTSHAPLPEINPDGRGQIRIRWAVGLTELHIIASFNGVDASFTRDGVDAETTEGDIELELTKSWLAEITELMIEQDLEAQDGSVRMVASARGWLGGQIRNQNAWRAEAPAWERSGHQGPWGRAPESWDERLGAFLTCRRCGALIYAGGRATDDAVSRTCVPEWIGQA